MPTLREQKQKEALTLHSLDREKHSTLHTCGTKILPGEEDGVVVMLGVLGVQPLLGVCPAAHLLQTPGRIPALNQADGLDTPEKTSVQTEVRIKENTINIKEHFVAQTWQTGEIK